jgi:hypothetical protein
VDLRHYVTWFIFGFVAGYCLVTLFESLFHDWILHAGRAFRRLQSRCPRMLFVFSQGFRSHTLVHHGSTFKKDHVTQFTDEPHQQQVDHSLSDSAGRRIVHERYGVTIKFRSILFFLVPLTPFVAIAASFAPWACLVGFLIPIALYPTMSGIVHPYLHMTYTDAITSSPWWLRPVLKTPYIRFLWRYHWLHHQYPQHNFNLLLGGDFLRRVNRAPTDSEIKEMEAIGIPVD